MTTEPLGDASVANERYLVDGWFRFPSPVSEEIVAYVRASVDQWIEAPPIGAALEADGRTLRAVHGCHIIDDFYARLARLPMFLNTAKRLLHDDVYVYQFKVNIKQALEGREWPWHTDYSFWANDDGMSAPNAVNVSVNIDDVHDLNGPLMLLSGSHRAALRQSSLPASRPSSSGSDWRDNVSAALPYTIEESVVRELADRHPRTPLLGPAGSAFAFHPSVVHSSSNNRSPQRRSLLIITYNAVSNAPDRLTRPEFLVSRDTAPLQPLTDPVAQPGA